MITHDEAGIARRLAEMTDEMKKLTGRKQSGEVASTIAAKVLGGYVPTPEEVRTLAASVLSQDETRGQRSPRERP